MEFIKSFTARFRNDVYLESVESGTIVSGGNLGLDANNKIVKAAEVGSSVDLTSTVHHVYTGGSNLTDNAILTGNGASPITAESTLTYSGETLTITSTSSSRPTVSLLNTNADENAPTFNFMKVGASAADNDTLGSIVYTSTNDAVEGHSYADFVTTIDDASDGDESGKIAIRVAANGNLRNFIEGTGTLNDIVDVSLAYGTGSKVTVAGHLTLGSTDGTNHQIGLLHHDNGVGGNLIINAGGVQGSVGNSNLSGGNIELRAGGSTGAASGGSVEFYSSTRGSGGDAANTVNKIASIEPATNQSNFFLFEAGGASADDFFQISCIANGATTISTRDSAATAAHLVLDADGAITLDSATSNFDFDASGVELAALGAASFELKGSSTQPAKIHLYEDTDNGTNKVSLQAPETIASDKQIRLPDAAGTVQLQGTSAGKQLQIFSCNFYDNISTVKHYLPFKDINEQVYAYQDEVSMLAPCDGRIVSVTLRPHALTISSDCTLTVGIETKPVNTSIYSPAYTSEETEALVVTNAGDDSDGHVFHFAFSNEKHFESTEMFSVSLQSNVSMGTNTFWHATVVIEWDWTTFLGTTSVEIDSTP